MRRGIVWLLLALTGCDVILNLHENDGVREACNPVLAPDLDQDGDGMLNATDACPFVKNQDPSDEDADGTLDACDLCPQLAGDEAAGGDPDCDGLGAGCDPDSAVPHDRRFYGFGSPAPFTLTDIRVTNGQAAYTLTNNNTTSTLLVNEPGAAEASYELAVLIKNARLPGYWSHSFRFTGSNARFELVLKHYADHDMKLAIERNNVEVVGLPLDPLAIQDVGFRMRVTTSATKFSGEVFLANTTTPIEVDGAFEGPVQFGFETYRDMDALMGTTEVTCDYLVYTTLRP